MSEPAGKTYERIDLDAIRGELERARGPNYWRSLEELAGSAGFQEFLHREFPRQAAEWIDDEGRRRFLKLMGASLALAGLGACTKQPAETIMPYVHPPEEIIPGRPLYYATAMPLGGAAIGLLVESHMGRPTKIEGNPDHPASLGATDAFCQASIIDLYDPDRSQTLSYLGDIRPWAEFLGAARDMATDQQARRGAGLRFLTETVISPALADQMKQLLARYPAAKWHQYEPAGGHSARAGAQAAFGQPVNTCYNLAAADVILSLDSDFLCSGPASVRYARDFAARRRVRGDQSAMSRFYAVESSPTATGAKADHRLPMSGWRVEQFAAAVAAGAGDTKFLSAVVRDLHAHRGSSVVIPGDSQTPAVHALAHAMNAALDNVGKTVLYTDPVEANPVDQIASLRELVNDMDSGAVEVLVILGANPVYSAPADFNFRQKMSKVKLRIHLGLYEDETAELCQWHIPEAHYLEAWSDTRAYDGTATIMQPLIAPLYGGRSAHELLAAFSDQPNQSGYEILQGYWKRQHPGADFETWWRRSVHDGVVADTGLPLRTPALRGQAEAPAPRQQQQGMEVLFRTDPHIYDGRFNNNGFLQELPKPLTKLTWDNAALMSVATAQRLGLQNEDRVELTFDGRKVRAAAWMLPGQPDDSVTLHLGYGRSRTGRTGTGTGFNAYTLRTSNALWSGSGIEIRKVGGKFPLATTQSHHAMEGREIVIAGSVEEYRRNPEFVKQEAKEPPPELTIYPGYKYEGYAWGMAIDQTACVGCGACVIACNTENNIPVVGKEQVLMLREMHWLRIDTYYKGPVENPETFFQPVPCMQCENAPCELVCPTQATNHSSEGLNDMVYNRCVGTRYCSNNCPYKVRRFNFFLYQDWYTPSLMLQRNPDVSVRSRGVMEKCTYCVQRINEAKIDAEKEDRRVADGEIQTACQAVCPAQAIVFGDINDPNSRVAALKKEKLSYGLLAELNTRPRTTYLAMLRNPNPELEKA